MLPNQMPPAMPQQGAPMPQAQPQAPELRGEDVQMLLFSRVKELNEQEMQVLDEMITPETVPVLFKLFPELGILFERGSKIQAYMSERSQGEGMEDDSMDDQDMEEEGEYEENPLINNNISRGLMG